MVGSMLPMQGAWVPSLARELRSHMLHGEAKEEQRVFLNVNIPWWEEGREMRPER